MNVIEMFDTNNDKLKYQGKTMVRRVHLLKARNKRIINERKSDPVLSLAFVELCNNARKTAGSLRELMGMVREASDEKETIDITM